MTLHRVLSGSVKKGQSYGPGEDVDLTAEEAARLNKNGRKTVEPVSVAEAKKKAEIDAKSAVDKAEAEAKKKAEIDAKKGGGK